ncbi:MAG TPA: glycosyltransferase [Candidatus Saccharimonadales bacterium]|nr:glycosyltransferase [Candidatus Saccharimonadales bacterium]
MKKVAIVTDWIIGGGAENVVYELHKIYPKAPIYTSYCNQKWRDKLHPAKVKTGYLQYWPFSKLRKYIPFLRAMWFWRLKLKGYDVVISVSGAEAKAVNVADGTHICLLNAPTHYYWSKYSEYIKNPGFGRFNFLARIGLKLFLKPMRKWDYHAAQLPDLLIANSNYTKGQIQKYYQRESVVIHPPVNTKKFAKFAKTAAQRSGFVAVGRQTPYKKIDLAIKACNKNKKPLTVIGEGPQNQYLQSIAQENVKIVGSLESIEELAEIVGSSEALLFPGVDDFGIVSIEALSAGTPVIAYRDGGALDYIEPGVNGEFFEPQTSADLAKKMSRFNIKKYTQDDIKNSSADFSIQTFRRKITRLVDSL